MENASKALIIAGAILVSILIISLGMLIFNQAKNVVGGNQMDELEMQQFNAKFTQYDGDSVRGSTVNSMLQAVVASNMAQEKDDTARQVIVFEKTASGETELVKQGNDLTTAAPKVKSGATYTVKSFIAKEGSDKGLVWKIIVKNNGVTGDIDEPTSDSDE